MENVKNPDARDDRDWLDQCDRLGVDPADAMERSLVTPSDDAPLPVWAE
jgi:hypothetical protein